MLTNRPCSCEGKTLDRLIQPTVMALLRDTPLHGYLLIERLGASPLMKGNKPNDAGVYRLLAMLEKQNLVSSRLAGSTLGPGKQVYRLTRSGRTCLAKWLATLESYHQDLGALIIGMQKLPAKANPEMSAK